MLRIPVIEEKQASKDVQDIYAEIKNVFGKVPNLFKTYAHFLPLLEANWNKVKAVIMQGNLNRKTKEAIAILISKDNSCAYCVAAHTAVLKSIGMTDKEIKIIESDIDKSEFTEKERELITFARKVNKDPKKVTDKEFEGLKRTGASNAEIIEALGVMEIFISFNRFLDSLRVEIDF